MLIRRYGIERFRLGVGISIINISCSISCPEVGNFQHASGLWKQLGSSSYVNDSYGTLHNALRGVRGDLWLRKASRSYGIDVSTLSRKRMNLFPRNPWRIPGISKGEEEAFVSNIIVAPLSLKDGIKFQLSARLWENIHLRYLSKHLFCVKTSVYVTKVG